MFTKKGEICKITHFFVIEANKALFKISKERLSNQPYNLKTYILSVRSNRIYVDELKLFI